ncbi:oligosaccharide flippase family protein [Hymenobacter taeanensis]|uniref:Oligosaccharide flippase family protein n=1 Tax=Hymenobacter taeanensis TaxID=2735321 RepID=A0A6M6BJF6_9BACT|nr:MULTISPECIES: polysaccharide biosynthesis C-terminal domain-containing protein [Hymenobacter]QJX48247.1 oligosaccharide flippase family protein [Hymenobacter taeanensis]UOQ82273.1 polysaccharide biosynthesis C-terminal domain-containing protein [Hymenobacter sp. 5414T-23]
MGIVQRQGLRNTVISYIGLALGFVSTALVLPNFLAPQQLGVTATLASVATLYAQIAAFGFASVGIRFFPYFRHPESGHRGFLPLLVGVPLLGFAVVTALYFLGKPVLLPWYGQDAPLLAPYYTWGAVLALFTMLYSVQDAYLKALYHTAFSSFVQDVLQRVLIIAGALLFGFGFLSFPNYVLWFVGVNGTITLLLTAYVATIGELHWRPTRQVLTVRPLRELLGMGAFTLLGSLSGSIIMFIDTLMVGAQVSVAAAGIYAVAGYISTALAIPARSLNKIAFPLLADYWKQQDLPRMADFYRRATRLNTLLGCYLALGIGLNLDFIYSLMRNTSYAEGTVVVLLLLGSKLFDGITGVNALIVITSPRYRYDLIFNVSLALLTVALNWLLIPRLGMVGAAVAACVAQVSINVARTWFVWHSYRMQPFTWRIPLILGIAAAAGGAAWLLPALSSPFLTMLLRSTVLTILYGGIILLTNSAPEATGVLQKISRRFIP